MASGWGIDMHGGYIFFKAKTPSADSYVWPVRGDTSLPAKVWRTGQIVSYRQGDDGDLRKGAPWPDPRFAVEGDCVTDNLTGLMWVRYANLPDSISLWPEALSFGKYLSFCGYSDWRVPNPKELLSLIDRSQWNPAISPGHPFFDVQTRPYWVSTAFADLRINAWLVGMARGSTETDMMFDHYYAVWPVRGGGNFPTSFLSLSKTGGGTGTVESVPPALSCGNGCTTSRESSFVGQEVTLTASPWTGSIFTNWSGACSGSTTTCSLTMTNDLSVTAHFIVGSTKRLQLSVANQRINKGNGTIQSDDGGIVCPGKCSYKYYSGTSVTLTAQGDKESVVKSWKPDSLGCSGTTCTVTMDKAKRVTAIFEGNYTLTVNSLSQGNGSGIITVSPPASECTSSCKHSFPAGTLVTLTAHPGAGSSFRKWIGCPKTSDDTCTVTLNRPLTVKAVFAGTDSAN